MYRFIACDTLVALFFCLNSFASYLCRQKSQITCLMNEIIESPAMANCIIEQCYREHRESIKAYITYKINDAELADDLTQDVFLHLMEYGQMIRLQTAKNMLYTIARNIVIDYLRRYYSRY